MTHRVHVRPQAHLDLQTIAGQIAAANVDVALDFWDAVESTYRMLAEHPNSGTRLDLDELLAHDVRRFVVTRYRT